MYNNTERDNKQIREEIKNFRNLSKKEQEELIKQMEDEQGYQENNLMILNMWR